MEVFEPTPHCVNGVLTQHSHLGSSLYSLGSDPTENTFSIVIDLFTQSLHINERLLCSAIPALRRHVTIRYVVIAAVVERKKKSRVEKAITFFYNLVMICIFHHSLW
jgi:hypothetical protein